MKIKGWDWVLIAVVLGGAVAMVILNATTINKWPGCECVNAELYGCSCREWVDRCFEKHESIEEIKDCISGELKGG